jgi:1,4-dihydroxy-2-naphthoyl-CoA hydrolase
MSIWHGTPTLQELNDTRPGTLLEHLDIRFTEIGEDFLTGTMPVDARTKQPQQLLHGGASVALAETLGSTGAALCVDPSRHLCVGLEVNANHVRSARGGRVIGTARAVHIGGTTQVWVMEIHDDASKLICTSRLTVAVIARRPAA